MRVTRKQPKASVPACPSCGTATAVRPLMFGLPAEEMFAAFERRDIDLGGCCLPEGPMPHWRCRTCGAEFA